MTNKKQIILNIAANALAMLVGTGINFIMTPFLTRTVGVAAYGFVPLASNFVSYVAIITTAFNSMGSRFITVELHAGRKNKANEYFSTIFFMNLGLAVITSIIFSLLLLFLENLINIPGEIETDIKILFTISFASAVFSLITNVYATATFCKNRLDLKSAISIIGTIVRAALLLALFFLLPAKVYYISIANIAMNITEGVCNFAVYKRIMGELTVKRQDFRPGHIRSLLASGIWNSVSQLSSILMTGLDLLVANIYINATESGILSIAKIMPSLLYTGVALIVTAFGPQFVIDYAKEDDNKTMLSTMEYSAKLISFLTVIPVGGFLAFGIDFFKLWVPEQNSRVLFSLAALTMLGDAVSYPIKTFDNVFAAVNKLRWPAIAALICGLLNVLMMIPLLKYTNWGLYAVAGTSTILLAGKDLAFKIPYLSRIAGCNVRTMWGHIFRYAVAAVAIVGISMLTKTVIPVSNWITLIIDAVITSIFGLFVNLFIIFDTNSRKSVLLKVKSVLARF